MTLLSKLLLAVTAFAATAAVGCASPTTTEEQGESTSSITNNTSTSHATGNVCGDPTPNPACDTKLFVFNAFDLAKEDPIGNLMNPVLDAKDCIEGLATIGAVEVASGGTATPAIIAAAAVTKGMKTIVACANTVDYLHKIGLFDNISCLIEPERNSVEVNTCECTMKCNAGIDEPDANGERYVTNKYKYGFMSPGAAICNCTNDTKAVACGWKCDHWASKDAGDCTCNDL